MLAYNYYNELYHYGVPGMRWGVRKKSDEYITTRASYRKAKKEYNKSFNKAYKKAADGYSINENRRRKNDDRWNDAKKKAETLKKASDDFTKVKNKDTNSTGKSNDKPHNSYDTNTYFEKSKKNAEIKKIGYTMSVAGTAMKIVGRYQYNRYKDASSPLRTAVMNGMGYGGKALQLIGTTTVISSSIKQYSDDKKYWK